MFIRVILSFFLCTAISARVTHDGMPKKLTNEQQLNKSAMEAYIWGYPLVLTEITKDVSTNVAQPEGTHGPLNQFIHTWKFVDASFKDIVSPNNDTLYSIAWLDLSKDPLILHVPNMEGRYYLLPILDAWTNVVASPGTRTTGSKETDFALVGPDWTGTLPANMQVFKIPTNTAWIIGRMQTNGPQEYAAVNALQKQLSLTPLSSFGKPYTPPASTINPSIDMKTPPPEQIAKMDANAYLNRLAEALKRNPPFTFDKDFIEKFKTDFDIIPGQPFDISTLDPSKKQILESGVKAAYDRLLLLTKQSPGKLVNGWFYETSDKMGNFGNDYLLRAQIAMAGFGANLGKDAVYPMTSVDEEGKLLDGNQSYVLHFEKDQTPPTNAFWSVTMYNDEHHFVPNDENKYAIHYFDPLVYNEDGSLDLVFQRQAPEKNKTNWLLTPDGDFNLIMRIYWPKESVLSQEWKPPAVKKKA